MRPLALLAILLVPAAGTLFAEERLGHLTTCIDRKGNGVSFKAGTSLTVDDDEINAWEGNEIHFFLDAGPAHAGRSFCLFGTVSGTSPGTPLPGGMATLPINWDMFTELLLQLTFLGHPYVPFHGTLDQDGKAEVILTLPPFVLHGAVAAHFAFCLYNPFDFASDAVQVTLHGYEGKAYAYDDGTSEGAITWTAYKNSVWMHMFDAGVSDSVYMVSTTFGVEGGAGGPAVGTPCTLFVFDDPSNDWDPSDGVLLAAKPEEVRITNSDTFNKYYLDAPVEVEGVFFVACLLETSVGYQQITGMDQTSPYSGNAAWFSAANAWDPKDLTLNPFYEMGSIGFPAYWLLRANDD